MTSTPPSTSASTNIPTIRLITATPSASGNSPSHTPWSTTPSPLLPKTSSPKARLVPKKKSKLGLLGAVAGRDRVKDKDKGNENDNQREIDPASARSFEIYVDPTDDPEIGEIIMVKKKKSRVGLDSLSWGPGALGEVTNVSMNTNVALPKEVGKLKGEEKEGKWWSIGRGRKDSKEKEKAKSMLAATVRAMCRFRVWLSSRSI
jgi:serine/arginine repetitive matrix protein 2